MIAWSLASSEKDAEEIAAFICTEPAPASVGPDGEVWESEDVWELEAQIGIQSALCPPPRGDILLGHDDVGLAAVCWWVELGGPGRVKLLSMGVALRLRRRGLQIGDLLMTEVVQRLAEHADRRGITCVTAFGLVHRSNSNRQALLDRQRFFYVHDVGEYQGLGG